MGGLWIDPMHDDDYMMSLVPQMIFVKDNTGRLLLLSAMLKRSNIFQKLKQLSMWVT